MLCRSPAFLPRMPIEVFGKVEWSKQKRKPDESSGGGLAWIPLSKSIGFSPINARHTRRVTGTGSCRAASVRCLQSFRRPLSTQRKCETPNGQPNGVCLLARRMRTTLMSKGTRSSFYMIPTSFLFQSENHQNLWRIQQRSLAEASASFFCRSLLTTYTYSSLFSIRCPAFSFSASSLYQRWFPSRFSLLKGIKTNKSAAA